MKTVVDFESYYKKKVCSVVELATPNYVKATDAYILSVVMEDGFAWCGTVDQARGQFGAGFWSNPDLEFWAANSNFDQAWTEKYFGPVANPWQCVLDLGVFHQYPRNLADLSKIVLGHKMDKGVRDQMNGVDYFQLPETGDAPLTQQRLNDYCLNDSVKEMEILLKLAPMSPLEEKVAKLTRLQNRRGCAIDLAKVARDKQNLGELKHKAFLKIPWGGLDEAPLSPDAFADWCRYEGIPAPASVDKRDEKCTALMRQYPKLAEVIEAMRVYRGTNTLYRKAESLLARVNNGILPLELLYCGAAHTRRWSSKGFNVQNLPKEPTIVSGDWDEEQITKAVASGAPIPEEVHFVWLRNWLVPRPGKRFLILDYSQIEPRCLNWLVGNEAMLSAIRAGYGIYEAHAKAAKGWKGAPGTMKKNEPGAYKAAKAEVLGLGYGMGAKKFVVTAATAAMGGLIFTETEATAIVKTFRKQNPLIVKFWHKLDNLIATAGRSPDKALEIEMPSGDKLIHWDVRCSLGNYRSITTRGDYSQNSIQPRLWGGTLTENVTQRMARDVMADAMVRLEEAGAPVIFSAHDEVIIELDEADCTADVKANIENLMTTPPAWCADLPLGVEGDFANCYLK